MTAPIDPADRLDAVMYFAASQADLSRVEARLLERTTEVVDLADGRPSDAVVETGAKVYDGERWVGIHEAIERGLAFPSPRQLRETQAALAASQADLTAAQAERDGAASYAAYAEGVAVQALEERDEAERERDLARAELASARQELELLRNADGEVIEHLDANYCVDCDIRMLPGTRHLHPLIPVRVTVTRRVE